MPKVIVIVNKLNPCGREIIPGQLYESTGTIVLATTKSDNKKFSGVVISDRGSSSEIGDFSDTWNTSVFFPFVGIITLKSE